MSNEPDLNDDGADPAAPAVSPALRGRLQKCYEHGMKLMQQEKYDFDYANTMFTECVARDPGNLIYVEAFLDNLQRKFKNNKKGGRLRGFGGKGNLKKAVAKKDWMGVIAAGLDLLKGNPWNVTALRGVAEACAALRLNEVELRFLKNALDANPKDPEVNRHCARSLGRMGQYDMAIACWHRVEESKRGDREAAQSISDLTLENNRASAGFGDAVELPSSPSSQKDNPASDAETGSESRKKIELTPRQKLERAILDDPTIAENYVELAKLLAAENRYGEAETVLKRGLSASGGDVKVREAFEDVQIGRARRQMAIAKQRAAADPSDEQQQLAQSLEEELAQRELEIFHARCERYPDNHRLQYEFGIRLKRVGKWDQAIEALSAATGDERITAAAQLEMGMCLQQKKDYQGAMQAYRQAVDGAAGQPVEVKKKALYLAGRLALGLKDQENGRKYLQEVHEIDPDYRDTSTLLQNL